MRFILSLVLLIIAVQVTDAFGNNLQLRMSSSDLPYGPPNPTKVLVTGAAGRTGKLVFSSLISDPRFEPVALVRTESSAKRLIKDTSCGLDHVVVCDVTELHTDEENGLGGLAGTDAMIICTSAVPYLSKISLVKAFLKVPINFVRGKKALDFRSLRFKFKPGQHPEKVDYEGQKAQIDLAKKLGANHVVIVSSMGGTDPTNFLNSVGKKADGTGNGDILLWKRKAEKYLVESGLQYTVIHPGGLSDAPPSEEEFVLGVDDELLENKKRSISRADVANLGVAALTVGKGKNVSFDCITRPSTGNTVVKTAEQALSEFLKQDKTTDYSK